MRRTELFLVYLLNYMYLCNPRRWHPICRRFSEYFRSKLRFGKNRDVTQEIGIRLYRAFCKEPGSWARAQRLGRGPGNHFFCHVTIWNFWNDQGTIFWLCFRLRWRFRYIKFSGCDYCFQPLTCKHCFVGTCQQVTT